MLSDLLGDDHNLAVLYERPLLEPAPALSVDVGSVVALLRSPLRQLQVQTGLLGERLYAEKPKRFLRRRFAYWKAWHAESGRRFSSSRPARPNSLGIPTAA